MIYGSHKTFCNSANSERDRWAEKAMPPSRREKKVAVLFRLQHTWLREPPVEAWSYHNCEELIITIAETPVNSRSEESIRVEGQSAGDRVISIDYDTTSQRSVRCGSVNYSDDNPVVIQA